MIILFSVLVIKAKSRSTSNISTYQLHCDICFVRNFTLRFPCKDGNVLQELENVSMIILLGLLSLHMNIHYNTRPIYCGRNSRDQIANEGRSSLFQIRCSLAENPADLAYCITKSRIFINCVEQNTV